MNEFMAKWQNLITGVLITLVILYGMNHFIYKPKIKQINDLKGSLKMLDSEIRMIKGGELLIKDIPAARVMIQKELSDLSNKVPSDTQTPYLINNFISVVGKGLNIDYNLIQPGNLVQEQRYKRLPLNVEFSGDYVNLNSYLSHLKNLPVTIRVDSLDLRRLSGTKELAIKMSLSAFVLSGGPQKPPGQLKEFYSMYDPFYAQKARVGGQKTEEKIGLKFTGYWVGKDIKAIINDEVVGVGQMIEGFTVKKISKDRVLVSKDKRSYELTLGGK